MRPQVHLFAALSSDVESNATAVVSAWAQAAPLSLPTAQAERLAAYEAEQAAKPKTEAERRAERDRKRQEMQERIAAKKAAKAAEKKAKEL